jgi:creatinine amidohydrolase
MQWQNLTIASFEVAVTQADGVCIVPLGVIEAHGPHLPLSTDMLVVHRLACAAAEIEPALVFPSYPWGINVESGKWPGSIILQADLVSDLLDGVCEEISRNGCKKIILLSGHGGNTFWLHAFVQMQLDQRIDYTPYLAEIGQLDSEEYHARLFETERHGHACECETSLMLYLAPESTHPEWIPEEPGEPVSRMDQLRGRLFTPVNWCARYPRHYCGDARPANAQKGRLFFEHRAEGLAELIRVVKRDTVAPEAYVEYQQQKYRR